MTKNTRFRAVLSFLIGNLAAQVYLGAVAVAGLYLAWDIAFVEHADASFAGIFVVLLALPWSVVVSMVTDTDPAWLGEIAVLGVLALGVLANTALISGMAHLIRRGGRPARSSRTARTARTAERALRRGSKVLVPEHALRTRPIHLDGHAGEPARRLHRPRIPFA